MNMKKKWIQCPTCNDKRWAVHVSGFWYQCTDCSNDINLIDVKKAEKSERKKIRTSKAKELGTYESDSDKKKRKQSKREVDEAYLAFIRTQPCLCKNDECMGSVEAHHVDKKSRLGSDYSAIPLCHYHHIGRLHTMGELSFASKYNINYNFHIARLVATYGMKKMALNSKGQVSKSESVCVDSIRPVDDEPAF